VESICQKPIELRDSRFRCPKAGTGVCLEPLNLRTTKPGTPVLAGFCPVLMLAQMLGASSGSVGIIRAKLTLWARHFKVGSSAPSRESAGPEYEQESGHGSRG